MMNTLRPIAVTFGQTWHLVLFYGIAFAILAQCLQLVLLILRFGDLPNYFVNYDWLSNLMLIVRSTPSVSDMLPIMFEEWWIEVGFMNYDYGNGISEWSLNVIPSRLFILSVMGGMISLLIFLKQRTPCSTPMSKTANTTAGLGAVLVCMTSAAMSWVVCCATPSWVVGLAMLGLGVSTSLALESLGPAIFSSGFILLTISLVSASRTYSQSTQIVSSASNLKRAGNKPSYSEIREYTTNYRRV